MLQLSKLALAATMVTNWNASQPFTLYHRVSTVQTGNWVNQFDQPIQPADPIQYFQDLGLYHRRQFVEAMRSPPETFVSKLHELDAQSVGKFLTVARFNHEFGGDYGKWALDTLKSLDGELLVFGAGWQEVPQTDDFKTMPKETFHMQYATSEEQRQKMRKMGLPGCEPLMNGKCVPNVLSKELMETIGTTSVIRLDPRGRPLSMRYGNVVTWGQLYLLGLEQGYTAMDVFATGRRMEHMLGKRENSWNCKEKRISKQIQHTASKAKAKARPLVDPYQWQFPQRWQQAEQPDMRHGRWHQPEPHGQWHADAGHQESDGKWESQPWAWH